MLYARFFNNLLLCCFIIALIDDIIALNNNKSNINKHSFDKSLLTEQKWNFSSAITLREKQKLNTQQQQELQHHQFALQPKQYHPASAFCGQQQQQQQRQLKGYSKTQQQQQHQHHHFAVLNCNAINVMADNFPNEIQNDIENEIQTEKRNDLLSKNATAGTTASSTSTTATSSSSSIATILSSSSSSSSAASPSSLSTAIASSSLLLTLSKTAASSSSAITSLTTPSPRALARVASATSSSFSTSWSSAAVAITTPIQSSTIAATLRPLLVASSLMTATTPALPLNFKLNRILSRPKRFIAFPEGSSLSVAVCFTVGIIGNPSYNYMAFGLNWGVSYDLPNASWILNHLHGFSRHPVSPTVLRRRSRRSLYKEIERFMDNMGYNGRDCILRALCESRQYFERTKLGMIGEMLRVVFSLPKQRIYTRELRENSDIKIYDRAYRRARDIDCAQQYDCGFSLLELALGRYSTPPPGYYENNKI